MDFRRRLRVMLKLRARGLLYSNFLACVAVTLITQAISMLGGIAAGLVLPSANEFVYAADPTVYLPQFLQFYGILYGTFLISAPLTMGGYAWFSQLSMNRRQKIRSVFAWLDDFRLMGKAFSAMLWLTLLALGWGLLFLGAPAAITWFVTARFSDIPVSAAVTLSGFLGMLVIAGSALTIYRITSYLPALFVLAAHPEMGVREAFRECGEYLAGRQWEFFELILSFLGWFLINGLTNGLTGIFVTPYVTLTLLIFTQRVRGIWLKNSGKPDDPVWTPEKEEQEDEDV